ncbi:pyridoxamine 5'-phosphate oxidase family protein, partial [Bordetella pertussis]|uniref:pyridoxamine 5'-phosphate oxidase family protein n=1 Tax=Bordetella pertussis TaxID=520 RepID=UPI0018A73237
MAVVRYDIPGALMSDSLVFHTDLPGLADGPWHGGELAMQERAGARERMAQLGPRVIRDYMPQQHRDFFAQLPFMLLATVDAQGDPWASVLEGPPGFAHNCPQYIQTRHARQAAPAPQPARWLAGL